NAFCDALSGWDRDVRLAVCPTQYFGKGDESYIVELGRGLYPAIDLFWTGRQICSREITVDEAVRFQRFTGRPPLYWDNYPVNDARMTDEMHIGPYLGREAELYRFSRGLVSNGMEYPESSKIAFAAIADYLWNPDGYEPELSWKRSIRALVGEKACGPFLTIADNLRFSCLYPFDSPELSERLHD